MANIKTTRQKALIAVGMLVALVTFAGTAWFGYWHIIDSRNPYGGHNSYGMRDYTAETQQRDAREIVAGLNTHDPDQVDVFRFHGRPDNDALNNASLQAIRENVTAVLPAPGCQYVVDGIEDKGEQDRPADLVPWFRNIVEHAWGFDMKLRQLCPGQPPTPHVVRVIAFAPGVGGFWNRAALYEQG